MINVVGDWIYISRFDIIMTSGVVIMTKKITCRVIDSTPLSPDNPDIQFGWPMDTQMYRETGQPVFNKPRASKNSNKISPSHTLDFYA